ncbi:hypothetical protein ACS0TY_034798 [Phlomoides rotata]
MGNKETPETLEEGFMVSKLSQIENPCDQILEKGKSVCINNLEGKFAADDYSLESEITHVELASKFGSGSVEESVVFDGIGGNSLMDIESLFGYPEDKLSVLMRGNDVNDNNAVGLEKNLEFCGNVEVCTDKVDEPFNKCGGTLHSHEVVTLEKVDSDEGDHVVQPHRLGSPTKLDVSGDCINLFVKVFGPLNGISENIDNLDGKTEVDHELGKSESNQEYSLEEDGTLSPGIKEDSCKNEGQEVVGEHECTFSSGDLVWVKTRNQSWWPGMVSQSKCEKKRVRFLVKYYGNPSFVWCDSSDLKPFIDYFERISGQNNSRSFDASVEKALCEIGQRIKSKMTCACFSKEIQTRDAQLSAENYEENSMSADKGSKFDDLLLSQLEPTTFYASIKQVACSIYAPGQVELTVLKNYLSSFYCSVGHRELPLELLSTDGDHSGDGIAAEEVHGGDVTRARRRKKNHSGLVLGDETTTTAKGFESRERKKSKYLSYPYVDAIRGHNVSLTVGQEKEDPKSPSSLNTNLTPLSSCSGKKSHKKGTKKPLKRHVVSKADNVDANSSELLAELFSTARDCFFLEGSKYSNSLKRFYSSFRMFAFPDVDITCKEAWKKQNSAKAVKKEGVEVVKKSKNKSVNLASVKESAEIVGGSQLTSTDNPPVKENVKKRAKKKKEQAANTQNQLEGIRVVKEAESQKLNNASTEGSVENAVGDKFSKTDNPQENVMRSKAEQNKERVISSGLESIQHSFSIGTNIFHNSSGMISFQQACSNVPVSGTTPEKTEGVIPEVGYTNLVIGLPDLNRNHPSFSSEHIPVGEPSKKLAKPLPEQMVFTPVSPNITGVNKMAFTPVSPNITGVNKMAFTPVSSSKDALQSTPQASNSVNGPNQSRSEGFTATESGSNVINAGLSPFSHYTLKMGIFGSVGTSEPKKRKRKEKTAQSATTIPDLNGNVLDSNSSANSIPEGSHVSPESEPPKKRVNKSDMGPNGEPLCGNILLNFAPGSTLPSLETLVATFSRFGLLKESELQVLSDSSIQIVYERRSDARFAYRSLEKGHSFGESLVSFTTDCMPPPSSVKKKQNMRILPTSALDASKNQATPSAPVDVSKNQTKPSVPVNASKNQTKPTETPNIAVIKKNVEMMKLTLEKSGNSLSTELKAKLENEIKTFLDKINSMTGSSSS